MSTSSERWQKYWEYFRNGDLSEVELVSTFVNRLDLRAVAAEWDLLPGEYQEVIRRYFLTNHASDLPFAVLGRVTPEQRQEYREKAEEVAAFSNVDANLPGGGGVGMEVKIGPYADAPATYHEYDPLAPEVARAVAEVVASSDPRLTVEHIGSTAVSGCAGKGIIDLMVLYPPGLLEAAKAALDRLGFQRQTTRDPFPEDRPMRVGSTEYSGKRFRLHAHVIGVASSETEALRAFRERLRVEPEFRAAYEARKRSILAAGVVDSVAYAEAKEEFIRGTAEHLPRQESAPRTGQNSPPNP